MSERQETADAIIAEMNRVEVCAGGEPCLRDYADRLDAAHKREVDALNEQIADLRQQRDLWSKRSAELVEKCNEQYAKLKQVGNAAKLREVLKDIGRLVEQIHFLYSDYPSETHEIARKVNAALAEPPRNCDRFATKFDAKHEWEKVCKAGLPEQGPFEDWIFAPATEKEGGNDGR